MNPKPRVLIAMHYLELGGAETALIGLLNAWDYSQADVDLFLYSHRGELMNYIPGEVNLLPPLRAYGAIESPIKDAVLNGCLGVAWGRWEARRDYRKALRLPLYDTHTDFIGRRVTPYLPAMGNGVYDLAISFLTPHHPVLFKTQARRKICWIHTDYSFMSIDVKAEQEIWGAYDNIISISPSVTEGFCAKFPDLREKIIEIENIIPESIIRARAKEFQPSEYRDDAFNILSIGRYCHAKNFDNVPDIMRRIIERTGREDIHWHIIGYGGDEWLIRKRIREAHMSDHVHMLGKRENPYPYIAGCDLYVQPSRYEGKSMAVREAQMLGRPVIITDYATSKSQLQDGVDGLIVPINNAACAEAISQTVDTPATLLKLHKATSARDYSGSSEVNKLYKLIS